MSEEMEFIVNLDDPVQNRNFQTEIGTTRGHYQILMRRYSPRRSTTANRYWWGVIVKAFVRYNAAQNVKMTPEQAHVALKLDILPAKVLVSRATGNTLAVPADTHTMTREQFSDLIEAGHAYMAELGVPLPDPHVFGGLHAPEKRRKSA
jgi:hypothetical protein